MSKHKRAPKAAQDAVAVAHRAPLPRVTPMALDVLAVLAAAALGALVWVGMFPSSTFPGPKVAAPPSLPALVWCVQALVVGIVIGVTLSRRPQMLRPLQAIVAALLAAVVGLALDPKPLVPAIIACAASGVLAVLIATWVPRKFTRVIGVMALVVVLVMLGLYTGVLPGPMHAGFEQFLRLPWDYGPQEHASSFDSYVFMRTALLMRQGTSYYPAFVRALKEDTRHLPLGSPFNFRPPLVISIWSLLPMRSMADLATYAVAVGALCALFAYLIAAEFVEPGVAVVAAVLVCRLYGTAMLYPRPWLALTEFWVAPIGLLGIWLTLRRQWIAAALVLCVALLGREMMALLLPAWFVALYLRAEMPLVRKHVYAGTAVVGAALALGIPYWMASRVTEGTNAGVSRWFNGGPIRLFEDVTLTHNGLGLVVMSAYVSMLVLAVAVVAVVSVPTKWRLATVGTFVGVYTIFLICISGGDWSYYWGVPYLTVLMSFAPVIAARFAPSDRILAKAQ